MIAVDRAAAQRGFVATELALGVAVLLVPVVAVVLTIPTWSERQTTARFIAREVARAVARDGTCDSNGAAAAAVVIGANLGLDSPPRVDLECAAGTELAPGSDVTVHVTVTMPAVRLPGLGAVGTWTWTASHRQPVDVYGSAR
ncbi:MAG TPA: hypothetical protein VH986_01425 [Acidimicrobiia bacterium]